ncbi:transcriptional regulator, XRE family protein [Streptomyces sp. NPDC004237]|uniref:transcriptional regulator, XRE family protein n=1 Tax=Streptomyces sp. NPDC004237 TaxID=3154455 RepID=UPI0033BE5E5F
MPAPSLFRVLIEERRWNSWGVFAGHFQRMAQELASEREEPELASLTVPRKTFERWASGTWYGTPWRAAAVVLERLLGFPCSDLFAPAPDVLNAKAGSHDRGGLRAAAHIGERWPTSRLFMSAADDLADSWQLTGGQDLDGTTMAVQFYPASAEEDGVRVRLADTKALDRFLRPARRGVLVGVQEGDDDLRLYMADSLHARHSRRSFTPGGALRFSPAQLLDDFTYGLFWALAQFDDGLLADDQTLEEEWGALSTYLSLPRSAPGRMALPVLTTAGSQWLGSAFCAQHIQSRLQDVSEPPVFWTREQTGEQAAAWIFFRHKIDYLESLSARYAGVASPLARSFCIPEEEVARSAVYERILLFLAITLMEMHKVHVHVTSHPDYSSVDGFALASGQRAAVANWVRTDSVWAADTVTDRSTLHGYREVFADAREDSIMQGANPMARLQDLAEYLNLNWAWITDRCREFGDCGIASVVRPRSRHLSVHALDNVLRYLGSFAPDG